MSICLDGDKNECQRRVKRDSLNWSVVCDGKMFETPIVTQLGMLTVPSVIVTNDKGRIIKRNLNLNEIESEIEKFLK